MIRAEILEWLAETRPARLADLYREADRVRHENVGDAIHLRGLIEISNRCAQDCHYCGLRRSNRSPKRYQMTVEEIVRAARGAAALGIKTIVLQSGEAATYGTEELCSLVRRIKDLGVAVTLSLGEKSREEFKAYRDAGADRYLLKFETSDRSLFEKMRPGARYDDRFLCLEWLKELGYEVGSGVMVGLPGQTAGILADDILCFKDLGLDMIGVGPFLPHPETPLAGNPPGDAELALKALALTRLVARRANMPATTSIETLTPGGRERALRCGANVVMPNQTPLAYRALYEIYPNQARRPGTPAGIEPILALAARLGRPINLGTVY